MFSSKLLLCLCLEFVPCFTSQATELKTPINISSELIEAFIKEGTEIAGLIDKVEQETNVTIRVVCATCSYALSCAEIAGNLFSRNNHEGLEELKKILHQKDALGCSQFILKVAQENLLICPLCEKFTQWKDKKIELKDEKRI